MPDPLPAPSYFILNEIFVDFFKSKHYRVRSAIEFYILQHRGGILNPFGHETSGTTKVFLEEIVSKGNIEG